MESEKLKALSFVRRALLRKNEKIRDLARKLQNAEEEIENLKTYQWKCADLEEEVRTLQNDFSSDSAPSAAPAPHFCSETVDENTGETFVENEHSFPSNDEIKVEEFPVGNIDHESQQVVKESHFSDPHVDTDAEDSNFHSGDIVAQPTCADNKIHHEDIDPLLQDSTSYMSAQNSTLTGSSEVEAMLVGGDVSDIPSTSQGLSQQLLIVGQEVVPEVAQHGRYRCPYCQQVFVYKQSLSRHISRHTGFKPHKCPQCSYRSARKDSLKMHISIKHYNGPTNSPP